MAVSRSYLIGFAGISFFSLIVMGNLGCTPLRPTEMPEVLYERDVGDGLHNLIPIRGERGALALHVDGEEVSCSVCHEGFEGDLSAEALEGEHANITFDHGANLLCLNCHNPKNSDAYVYHDGSEIPGDEPNRLCAKCHGPHYREWQNDVHGRVNRFWDKAYGEQRKAKCIECHDPHKPAFPKMAPQRAPVLTRFDHLASGESNHE